jgi:hypothetical protein
MTRLERKLSRALECCLEDSQWRLDDMENDLKIGYCTKREMRAQKQVVARAEAALWESSTQRTFSKLLKAGET